MCRWAVRVFVVVSILLSVMVTAGRIVDIQVFGEFPTPWSIVTMAVDGLLLDITYGVLVWRWLAR